MFKNKICSFVILLCSISYSQQNLNFSGTVKFRNKILSEIIIELNFKKRIDYAISNSNGLYQFNIKNFNLNDTLFIRVSNPIYKKFKQTIILTNEMKILDIDLEILNIEQLAEIEVKTSYKTKRVAGKTIHKINKNEYIKNATAEDVLSKIPSVFYNKNTNKTLVDGTLNGIVFVDGTQTRPNEIKQLNVSEIDKVEVINNPSAIYGADFTGAIINITTKKGKLEFFKGSIEANTGLVINSNGISASISYKKGFFNIKTDASFLKRNEKSSSNINRIDNNVNFDQKSTSSSINYQDYFNTILGFKFSEKLKLTIDNYNGGFEFDSFDQGVTILNNSLKTNLINAFNTKNRETEVASVLKYKIQDNKVLNIKHSYLLEKDSNINEVNQSRAEVGSQCVGNSFNINYNLTEVKFIKNTSSIIFDLKYINRFFNFKYSDFYINQNIFNATIDISNQWTDKFSSQNSLTFEKSNNKNDLFNKDYNLFLPTINLLYGFEKSFDLSFGYSRRLLRPGSADLNDALLVFGPGVAYQGNANLNQQFKNYFFLSLNKSFDSDTVGLKFFNSNINDFISDVYKSQGTLLIRTIDNVAKFNSTGFNISYTTIILKKLNLNLDSGFNYNVIENDAMNNLIDKNSGISFNGSFYLDANFFKNKLAVSLSGYQDESPNFTLLSKRVTYPSFSLSLSTNLFKEKIKLSLYANNLMGNNFTGFNDTSTSNNFNQTMNFRNNQTNIQLGLSYNFGKTFDDIEVNKIENEDIRK